jgi:uncharacterized membrane protein YdbT with pleckstrin-like domain
MTIDEKIYPIQEKWLSKGFCYMAVMAAPFLGFAYFTRHSVNEMENTIIPIVFVGAWMMVNLIVVILQKDNFHYEFTEKIINLQQGVISKSQRHVFYGRVQNIILSQDLFDRLLGIASLTIETASDAGGAVLLKNNEKRAGLFWFKLGFLSNSVTIPGLLYPQALMLRKFVLEQIKNNPIDDAQSGL